MEQVVVRAEAQEPSGSGLSSRLVSMNIGNLPQRDGERCNIEFSFAVGVDNVKDIIGEMLEELNLDLRAADAEIIEGKIDQELQRCVCVLCAAAPPRLCGGGWLRLTGRCACRAQLAAERGGSTPSTPPPNMAHLAHGAWPTPAGEMPFLHAQDRSAFESGQGTHYSVSAGSRDESNGDSERAAARRTRSWRESEGSVAHAAAHGIDPPRLGAADDAMSAAARPSTSYADVVAPRGPPIAAAMSAAQPVPAVPPSPLPAGPPQPPPVSRTASPAAMAAPPSAPAAEAEGSKRQGNELAGESGGANGGLETFKQVRRRLEEALLRPEVRKASRADLRAPVDTEALAAAYTAPRQ